MSHCKPSLSTAETALDLQLPKPQQDLAPIAAVSREPALMLRVDWFMQPDFTAWADKARQRGLASWGYDGHFTEDGYPDVFVGICPSLDGEGTDSDMPEQYWEAIVAAVRGHLRPGTTKEHIVVRIAPAV